MGACRESSGVEEKAKDVFFAFSRSVRIDIVCRHVASSNIYRVHKKVNGKETTREVLSERTV